MELHNYCDEDYYRNMNQAQMEFTESISDVTSIPNPKKAGKWTEEDVKIFFKHILGLKIKKTCFQSWDKKLEENFKMFCK